MPATYARATWLFLRLLGIVYLIAFWSLGVQIVGLVGHDGILPVDQYGQYMLTDAALRSMCVGGVVLASLLAIGIAPALVLSLLWLLYLVLSIVCRDFLSFQWDALLLEAGLLAIFLAPLTWVERPSRLIPPPRIAVWLMLGLLFRLMVGSGAVKLASGDPTWHNLTALSFHFETQPIPTPVAWYAHHLPLWFLKASTMAVLAIEIGAPFLILGPRRIRGHAFVLLAGLQLVIALTGNYAFFNLLAAALCLFLLDDTILAKWGGRVAQIFPVAHGPVRRAILIAVAIITVPVSAVMFLGSIGVQPPAADLIYPVANLIAPLRSVNGYGLFAVMTTTRPEIIVEGSEDGTTWVEYEFKYKAGDVHRRPPWVAPHQPRLDWQMWFAALGRFDDEAWFQNFCARLLEGDAAVLSLLARDPLGGRKPRYVRASLYRYRFATPEAHQREGVWWTRELIREYAPVLSLAR